MAINASTLKAVDDPATVSGGFSQDNLGNIFLDVNNLQNYANDAAAAAASPPVPIGGLYRTGSSIMVRVA